MTTKSVIKEIEYERNRQMMEEGWTEDYDDKHTCGELAKAAACYAAPYDIFRYLSPDHTRPLRHLFYDVWPWEVHQDKRRKHSRRRSLVIAGALIVAEIERLDRLMS